MRDDRAKHTPQACSECVECFRPYWKYSLSNGLTYTLQWILTDLFTELLLYLNTLLIYSLNYYFTWIL